MAGDGNRTPPSTVANPKGLLVSESQQPALLGDPVAAKYLRKFVGGAEILEGSYRYCIWMPDPVSPDIRASQELQTRFSHVEEFRRNSTYFAIRRAATTPYAFARVSQPSQQFLCVPRHFTSERDYITASYLDADVIAGDTLQITEDPDGLIFAVLSSSMFMAWQRAVGSRIHHDLRFGVTTVLNTFPLPTLDPHLRSEIISAGAHIIAARQHFPHHCLGAQYDPRYMEPEWAEAPITP